MRFIGRVAGVVCLETSSCGLIRGPPFTFPGIVSRVFDHTPRWLRKDRDPVFFRFGITHYPRELKRIRRSAGSRFYRYILPFALLKSKLSESETTVRQRRKPIRWVSLCRSIREMMAREESRPGYWHESNRQRKKPFFSKLLFVAI